MLSTCKPCSVHLGTVWCLHENDMLSTCKPHGVYVDTTWFLHGHHVVAMWTQHSYYMDTTWFPGKTPYGFHVVTMCTPCDFQVVTTMCQMWTPYDFHMKITLFLCGQNMVSMWLIFHHFYIISVVNRSRKIANLWKPVTSLIMVRFSIRKKFWKARGVLYQPMVSFSQISRDFGMNRDVWESSWCLWCLWHHELSRTSCFMPKSREISLIDITG